MRAPTSNDGNLEGSRAARAANPGRREPVIGIALGAGVARGWSHIGVLRELADHGIAPTIIAGSSIGAVVGGCHAAGQLAELEDFARRMTRRGIFNFLDISFAGGGLISGGKLRARLGQGLSAMQVEDLPLRFAAVATEVGSGHEIWLTHGPLVQALEASYAIPGIFEPVKFGERWLFDGALVNPIPVTVCRVLGADLVLAVGVNASPQLRGAVIADKPAAAVAGEVAAAPETQGFFAGLRTPNFNLRRQFGKRADNAPSMAQVITDAFNITQDRIARSRLAGDPPDVMIRVRTGDVGLFDFHRADELIDYGRTAVQRALPDIKDLIAQVASGAPPGV